MSLKKVKSLIDGTSLKINDIVNEIDFKKGEDNSSAKELATKYAFNKLKQIKDFDSSLDPAKGVDFLIQNGLEKYGVIVIPKKMPDKTKSKLDQFKGNLNLIIQNNEYDGVIIFTPFLMNKNYSIEFLKKKLPIQFINIPYDQKSLERIVNPKFAHSSNLKKWDIVNIEGKGYHVFYEISKEDIIKNNVSIATFYKIEDYKLSKVKIPIKQIIYKNNNLKFPSGYNSQKVMRSDDQKTEEHRIKVIKKFYELKLI